jgi:hypothetical protein
MDKPKIVLAGVDAGAKILVELTGESAVAEAATAMKQNKSAKIRSALRLAELCRCRIFHLQRAAIGCRLFGGWALSSHA